MLPSPPALPFVRCTNDDWGGRYPNYGRRGKHCYVGEVIPGECAPVVLGMDKHARTMSSLEEKYGQLL